MGRWSPATCGYHKCLRQNNDLNDKTNRNLLTEDIQNSWNSEEPNDITNQVMIWNPWGKWWENGEGLGDHPAPVNRKWRLTPGIIINFWLELKKITQDYGWQHIFYDGLSSRKANGPKKNEKWIYFNNPCIRHKPDLDSSRSLWPVHSTYLTKMNLGDTLCWPTCVG